MGDEDNRRLIASTSKYYVGKLPPEDIRYAAMIATFRCLRWHDYELKNKFTTSLYRFLKWELDRSLRDYIRSKNSTLSLDECSIAGVDYTLQRELGECLDRLSDEDADLLRQRYIHGMTVTEIGENNGYNKMKASRKVSKAMKRLKEIYNVER